MSYCDIHGVELEEAVWHTGAYDPCLLCVQESLDREAEEEGDLPLFVGSVELGDDFYVDDPSEYRRCITCGGEFWPGGTTCTCTEDFLKAEREVNRGYVE